MNPMCRAVRMWAPSGGEGVIASRLDAHVRTCLACQAEFARYGKLRRHLAGMAEDVVTAPESLAAAVATAITRSEDSVPRGSENSMGRIIAATSAVTAAAAGTIAVILWRHSRPAVR